MGASIRLAIATLCACALMASRADAASEGRTLPGMYSLGQARQPLPLVASAIEVTVDGPFAEATVVQRFRNPFDHAIEAVYIFPLPDDAAVSSMTIHAGERTIVARIEDRAAARARYEAAVAAGVTGALLEAERPDVFTQQVTAIPPHAEIAIELRWDAGVARRAGAWELAVPLVVGPRYVPGTPNGAPTRGTGWSADTDRAPDASRVTPETGDGVPTTVRVHLRAGSAIEGVDVPSHDADIETRGATAEVALRDRRADRDVIVRWRTRGEALSALTDADGFVAIVVPAAAAEKTAPRDWIVIADVSKSMTGDGMVLVRGAVRALLDRLAPGDRIALVTGAGARVVELGGAASIKQARAWIDAATPSGTGDLAAGVTAARSAAKHARQPAIVLITDGLVANDAEVLAAADHGPPVFAIGVGAAPNRGLLDAIARRSSTTAHYLSAADDVDAAAAALLTPAPSLSAATIEWGGLVADPLPATVPALAPGDAAVVIARVDRPRRARVAIAARALELPATWTTEAPRKDAVAAVSVIARRWARAKLDALLASGVRGEPIRALGLRYGLVTPETALVAVGDEVVVRGGVTSSVSVPVALPAGMRWQAVFGPDGDRADANRQGTTTDHKEGGDTLSVKTAPGGATTTGTTSGGEAAPTAPEPARESMDVSEESLETIAVYEPARWRFGLTLGAGALVAPDRHAIGLASLRADHRLTDDYRLGLDLTVLAAPAAADDRVAVALMGALSHVGLWHGRIGLELGVGPELASNPGLGYAIAAHLGYRYGLVLRWDGAVLFGSDGAAHRGSATAGFDVSF